MSALLKRPDLVRAMNNLTLKGVQAWWMRHCEDGIRLTPRIGEESGVVVTLASTQGDGTFTEFAVPGAATPEEIHETMTRKLADLLDGMCGL